jgi:hypothetical protein
MLKNPIVLDNFQKGVAASPYFGYEIFSGLDVTTTPGVVKVNPTLKKSSGTTISDGYIRWMKKSGSVVYAESSAGTLYKKDGSTWSSVTSSAGNAGQGLAIWKGYVFEYTGQGTNVYGPISGTPAWTTSWGTALTGSDPHPTLASQDDNLYIGCKNYVASLSEALGQTFSPGSSATYNLNDKALDLPAGYYIVGLADLGKYLMIAANNADTNQSDIFTWDRTSSSYNSVVKVGNDDIHTILTVGNLLYVIAGAEGIIYVTDGTNLKQLNKLPDSFVNRTLGKSVTIHPDAICFFNNKIYFATSKNTTSNIPALIWSYTPSTNALIVEHTISTGNSTTGTSLIISSLINSSDVELLAGWQDSNATAFGVDITDNTRRYTGYTAYFISQMFSVGSKRNPHTFQNVEIQLAKPLVSGEGVKVYYRTAHNGSWVQIGSAFETTGGQSYVIDFAGTVENIQFKVSLTTPSGSESTPELIYIKAI